MSTAEIKTQKPKKRFNKKIAIVIASVLIIGTVVGVKYYTNKQPKPVMVSMSKASKSTLKQTISVTGNIEPKNRFEITLNPAQKVVEVLAKEGQSVKEGDVLLKLDTEDLNFQLEKANNTLEGANSTLNRLSSSRDKGTLESSVKLAEMSLADLKAKQDDAKKKMDQNKEMLAKGFIAKSDYEASEKVVKDFDIQIQSAELKLSDAQKALADYDSTKSEKAEDQNRQIASANMEIENINKKVSSYVVKANGSGVIMKNEVKAGENPKATDNIVIFDTSAYYLTVNVSQYDAISIAKGQKAEIKLKGIDKKYTGTVDEIGTYAEKIATGTSSENKVKIKILLDSPDDKLKVGYEADVDITLKEKKDILAINYDAILKDKDGSDYIFVVKDGKAAKKKVKTGLAADISIEIEDGLKDGEEYIANPSEKLKEGDLVNSAAGVKKK